ncbi:magnesium chelatase, subunit ChlI family protein [Wolbachia endosymbiont of Trichogramma pretiosum]|nr:magnesium chelatase, subunit ChlI family protein [Wolbachia endosymbiont of Trichogramma pretiosum]
MLLVGPPSTGKSMLTKRFIELLPDLTEQEMIDINIIYSITKAGNETFKVTLPFREPHHSCSMLAMIGGGKMQSLGKSPWLTMVCYFLISYLNFQGLYLILYVNHLKIEKLLLQVQMLTLLIQLIFNL